MKMLCRNFLDLIVVDKQNKWGLNSSVVEAMLTNFLSNQSVEQILPVYIFTL